MGKIPGDSKKPTPSKTKSCLIWGTLVTVVILIGAVAFVIWQNKYQDPTPRSAYWTDEEPLQEIEAPVTNPATPVTVVQSDSGTSPGQALATATLPPALTQALASLPQALPAGWSQTPCPAAGVLIPVPPGFEVRDTGIEYYVIVVNMERAMMVDVECTPASHGGTLESELAHYLAFQENVTWGTPIYDQSGVGPFAASEGPNTHGNPIAGMVIGPTRAGTIITFWGQAPGDNWLAAKETFMNMARWIQYAP